MQQHPHQLILKAATDSGTPSPTDTCATATRPWFGYLFAAASPMKPPSCVSRASAGRGREREETGCEGCLRCPGRPRSTALPTCAPKAVPPRKRAATSEDWKSAGRQAGQGRREPHLTRPALPGLPLRPACRAFICLPYPCTYLRSRVAVDTCRGHSRGSVAGGGAEVWQFVCVAATPAWHQPLACSRCPARTAGMHSTTLC